MKRTTLARRLTIPALALAALSVVGCGAQSGDTLVQYEKGVTGNRIVRSPGTGTAALYSGNDLTPEVRTAIEKGERIGFRDDRPEGGGVMAVAGDYEQPVEQGTVFDREFYWKLQKPE